MTSLRFQTPKQGRKIQVIGAGLPRTGTNSFCAALSILLDGPCYHAGVQWGAQGATDEIHIKAMTRAAHNYPYDDSNKRDIMTELESLLDGYVAAADPPLSLLYPELLEIFPGAKVIVTVRDRDAWSASMLDIIRTSQPALAGLLFFWLPSVRWLPTFSASLTHLFYQKYGINMKDKETCLTTWEMHCAQLEKLVPADQLVYYNVKDGWKPLCEALDLPIPDVPFPRLNDAKDLEQHFKNLALRGLARWALAIVIGLCLVAVALLLVDRSTHHLEAVQDTHSTVLGTSVCLLLLLPIVWALV